MERARRYEQAIEHDQNGAPILVDVAKHLVALERMQRFRHEKLNEQAESPGVLGHYAKELSAIKASIAALRYHRATIQGLPEPLGLLRELVAVYDQPATEGHVERFNRLFEEARGVLLTYPSAEELTAQNDQEPR